ncbi:MAG: hypothetical protein IKY98_04830 [Alphaproteobacteria bacterium]|nr:hypothetical protein [Alphaproteobacteria bacterium]
MSYLSRTTLDEIAALADEMELNDRIVFTTEDPDELKYYKLQPCEYNLIYKTKLLYESDYVIIIGRIDGNCTIAKDISILTNGNINDEDSRIDGIKNFLEEYYEKYMEKNKDDYVYLILD